MNRISKILSQMLIVDPVLLLLTVGLTVFTPHLAASAAQATAPTPFDLAEIEVIWVETSDEVITPGHNPNLPTHRM